MEKIAFCDKIFLSLLYFFYEQIWDINPENIVQLVENNTLFHQKLQDYIKKKDNQEIF